VGRPWKTEERASGKGILCAEEHFLYPGRFTSLHLYASPWGLLELRYHVPTDQQRETEDWIKLLTEARQKVGEDFPLM
jgi:hypothetical protein